MEKNDEFLELVSIVERLRGEKGCPWDRAQTHESLAACVAEESGEVLQAIANQDLDNLCEELGDQLYLILLHSQIARENGEFTLEDVIRGISEKMVRRHPHVFGGVILPEGKDQDDLWNQIKNQEKGKKP